MVTCLASSVMFDPQKVLAGSSVLVTGGAGFIGSHLVSALAACDAHRIVVLDNAHYGSWANLPDDHRIEPLHCDLGSATAEELRAAVRGIDYVFHLAAEKHNQSLGAPERVLQVNVDGTWRLFRAAAESGVKKVIFSSSLYANGRLGLPAMHEDDRPDPRTVYGISKLTGEHLLRHLSALRSTTFRLFFVYGPKQYAGTGYKSVIVTNFERILQGQAPVVHGDGEQRLDYVYVDDVVRALLLGLDRAADGELINIGSARAVSVNELTSEMLRVARSSLTPVHDAADWTAGTHRVCVNERAERVLNWFPVVPMEEGLARVYSWMKAQQ